MQVLNQHGLEIFTVSGHLSLPCFVQYRVIMERVTSGCDYITKEYHYTLYHYMIHHSSRYIDSPGSQGPVSISEKTPFRKIS